MGGHADSAQVSRLLILPAIDLRGGQCVRLIQGDYGREKVYGGDPAEVAKSFEAQGADVVHVVDLDAAKSGHAHELRAIESIVRAVSIPVEVGGGVRTLEAASRLLSVGVARVICGTALVKEPGLAEELFTLFEERVVAGIDARGGLAALSGWKEQTDVSALELALQMQSLGCRRVILTDIARDGMLTGPNLGLLSEVAGALKIPVIHSGGIGSLDDVRQVAESGKAEGAIIGRALYEGKFAVADAVAAVHR